MRLPLIDRLVLKDLISPFFTGLFMFLSLVFAAGALFKATDWLVQGIPLKFVVKLVILSLPSLITQTFPMAMLLAGLLGFGRLSSDREAVAIFAAGVSFFRAARVAIVMGAFVSLTAFLWNDYVVPPATTAYWDTYAEVFKHLSKSDKPIYLPFEREDGKGLKWRVDVQGGYDARRKILKNVTITTFNQKPEHFGEPEAILYCDEASAESASIIDWTYRRGWFSPFIRNEKTGKIEMSMTSSFEEIHPNAMIPSLNKSFEDLIKPEVTDPDRKRFNELRSDIERLKKEGAGRQGQEKKEYDTKIRGMEVDLYGKFALPLASFIFGIVGAALGLNTKRGASRTVGFGMAIFIVFLYWVFYHSMFLVGKNGGLPPMLASFLADIVGSVVGVILAVRASK